MLEFSKRKLRNFRISKGLSKKDLANILDVKVGYVNAMEDKLTKITPELHAKLFTLFSISEEELLEGASMPKWAYDIPYTKHAQVESEILRAYRAKNNLTQKSLALKARTSQDTINNIESEDESGIQWPAFIRICKVLKIEPKQILKGSDWPEDLDVAPGKVITKKLRNVHKRPILKVESFLIKNNIFCSDLVKSLNISHSTIRRALSGLYDLSKHLESISNIYNIPFKTLQVLHEEDKIFITLNPSLFKTKEKERVERNTRKRRTRTNFAKLLSNLNMTWVDISKALDISKRTLYSWIDGYYMPSPINKEKLEKLLNEKAPTWRNTVIF